MGLTLNKILKLNNKKNNENKLYSFLKYKK